MPVINPQITVFSGITPTGGGGTFEMQNYFEVLENHFSTGASTKFTYNGGPAPTSNEGFILTPVDESNQYWQLNFRRLNATEANLMIDPGGTITDPGDTGTTPTGASVKASAEMTAWDLAIPSAAATGDTLVLIELDDALLLVHIDTGAPATFNPITVHAGKVYVPFFSNDVGVGDGQGDHYADGLGILGGITTFGASGANSLLTTSINTRNTARGAEALWFAPTGVAASIYDNRIDDKRRPRPFDVILNDTDGFGDAIIGYSRYLLYAGDPGANQLPGAKDESATDAWVRVRSTAAVTAQIIPWDLTTTPPF